VQSEFRAAIPRGKYDEIQASAEVSESLEAPIEKGQVLGSIVLKLEDKVIASVPLVAAQAIERGSIFSRALDEILMRLE
jgi:D-alanyl-D-alanine carboxypeptidase (penicillin-binding protein 5/6)